MMPPSAIGRPPVGEATRAVIATDAFGMIRHLSPTAEKLLGYGPGQLVDRPLRVLHLASELADRALGSASDQEAVFAAVRSGRVTFDRQCWTFVRKDATHIPVRATVSGVYGDSGELIAFAVLVEPLAAQGGARAGVTCPLAQRIAAAEARAAGLDPTADNYASAVSHELRTPITNVIGYTELLQAMAAGPLNEQQIDMLERVQSNATRLLEMLHTVLTKHAVDDLETSLTPKEVDLTDLVLTSVQRHAQDLDEKRLTLTVNVQDSPVVVTGVARDLSAMLESLVGNAVKFTPAGGRLAVELESTGEQCVLKVVDSGYGIPAEELTRVFDRTFRSSVSLAHDVPGAGLGLSTAQAIASMHGGRIDVRSRVGTGSEFKVSLPTAGVRAPAALAG
jgi:hypothetical protein